MTEFERMEAGLLYDCNDEDILKVQLPFVEKHWDFNQLRPTDFEAKQAFMKEVFAECGENCYIELPFRANWGGAHLHLGNDVFINFNLTAVDDGHIYIGDKVLIAPNVILTTAGHPVDPELRAKGYQFNKDIHIGNNVWLGAGVIVNPGVTIGDNSVIGSGSIVTKDIPPNVVAVGNPCRVLREINDRDKEYFYKDERIDL